MFSIFKNLAHQVEILVFFVSLYRGAVLRMDGFGGCASCAFRRHCHGQRDVVDR